MQILESFVLYCLNYMYDKCTENLTQGKQLIHMNITCDLHFVQNGYGKTN